MLRLFFLNSLLIITTFALPQSLTSQTTEMTKVIPSVSSSCREQFSAPHINFPTCTSVNGPDGLRSVEYYGVGCTCDFNSRHIHRRDDYQYTPGIGIHKLHKIGATFNNARKICNEEGAHLAIIETIAEEQVLLDLLKQSVDNLRNVSDKDHALIGIHDLFSEGDWVTVLGDSIHKNGYTKWSNHWGGQPDNGGGVQNCGTLSMKGGMDDVSCNIQFAFFCEIPGIRIAY